MNVFRLRYTHAHAHARTHHIIFVFFYRKKTVLIAIPITASSSPLPPPPSLVPDTHGYRRDCTLGVVEGLGVGGPVLWYPFKVGFAFWVHLAGVFLLHAMKKEWGCAFKAAVGIYIASLIALLVVGTLALLELYVYVV